jgi:predicted nucleic acid-binding protein
LSTDLAGTLQRFKPEKRVVRLLPRPRETLLEWTGLEGRAPRALLLDTTVYIHRAAGRLPPALQTMIDSTLLFHSTVALAELATGVANADPARAGWATMRDHYTALFAAVPESRLLLPDAQTWIDAGIIAGMLARLQGFQPHQRTECLNDALIYLTAARAGVPVLTANRDDFDLIQQVEPEGRFVHYGS